MKYVKVHKLVLEGDDMYEKLAWNHFCNTGDIESFLEYRRLLKLNEEMENVSQDVGEFLSEIDKSKGNRDQGSNL